MSETVAALRSTQGSWLGSPGQHPENDRLPQGVESTPSAFHMACSHHLGALPLLKPRENV